VVMPQHWLALVLALELGRVVLALLIALAQ
jgi:hypothetical protein